MVNWWANIDLSYKFAIVLGCSIIATFLAGFLKLWISTRRTSRLQLEEDLERANLTNEKVGVRKDLGVGDLFGVRAIEKGFYGGVSQVDLTTPSRRNMKSSAQSNELSSDTPIPSHIKGDSIASIVETLNGEPSTTEILSGSTKDVQIRLGPSTAGSYQIATQEPAVNMSNSMPPSPSFSNPSRTGSPFESSHLAKPGRSYDPQPSERRSPNMRSSPVAPSNTQTVASSTTAVLKTPTLGIFPGPQKPRQVAPQRPVVPHTKSEDIILTASSQNQSEGLSARPSSPDEPSGLELPLSRLSSNSNWGESIIDDYLKSRQSYRSSRISRPESTIRSTPVEAVLETHEPSSSPERTRHARNTSTSQKARSRSSSTGRKLIHATDSVRLSTQARKASKTDRRRDMIHYDPSVNRQRTRTGSVQGHPVDFDAPRESPFSDVHKSHSPNTSVDSTISASSQYSEVEEVNEEELMRENLRKINQWKARELKKAIEGSRAAGPMRHQSVGVRRPTGSPGLPPAILINGEATQKQLVMSPSPMELMKKWQEDDTQMESSVTPTGLQAPLSAEERAKVVMEEITRRMERKET